MQLKVFPNGTGEGAGIHISIIVPGEFDDFLTWPFRGIVTVHLVNQHKNGPSLVYKVYYTTVDNLQYREKPCLDVDSANCMGWGTSKPIAHAELGEGARVHADREYLKNNCLSFIFVFGTSRCSLSTISFYYSFKVLVMDSHCIVFIN